MSSIALLLGMQKFEYNGQKFHNECFTCSECSQPIGNNSFVPKEEGKLVCMTCYNDKFAQKCGKCGEVMVELVSQVVLDTS